MTDADNEDTKKKFREALERKNHQAGLSADHKDADSKVHHAHGPADHKREFRRKTG
ncbi:MULTISPECIES: DUF5302 domain-containing protein [Rhodococcus]|uniref:DUF5302 domain-containing protein n=2 Tax=Rhodococcus TaxID=1827 RepID=A0A402C9Z9_RHOWR|nr:MULTISPECIES: DUF5302 domain-containing protein [Rhodococcus]KAF0961641.1 putative proteinA [Rhodococcus sp. T7]MBV6755728.1 DUF5302 domain-containing protein [Rhodococcus opacus]QSE88682.1 DUF5302 domain-containing protein [Rhodococcus pseudokoreensis]QYB03779.1 DUF5302 domain-containing protein [Rhodococcus sp. USK10]GCE40482.1 hypothetical protein Rhow_004125 [Rhodococcus wratislaviensis]